MISRFLLATFVVGFLTLGGYASYSEWKWQHEQSKLDNCAWAERDDMFFECAKAFDEHGVNGAKAVSHRYGDPTGK